MKRKQWIALLMAAVVSQGSVIMAQEQVVNIETAQEIEMKNEYLTKTGQITEINKEDGYHTVLVGTPLDGIQYTLDDSEIIIDAKTLGFLQPSDLEIGMEITVVIPKNAPMTMSLPAMVCDQVAVIVNSPEVSTMMGYFNEALVNEEQTLALNITRDHTYITNTKGERRVFTEEDIKNHSAVVIYSMATYSIPAQTNPQMVLILPNSEVDTETTKETSSVANPEREMVYSPTQSEEVELVSVRTLAEKYGYKVTWDNEAKSTTLTKGETTIVILVGKAEVIQNESIHTLKEATRLVDSKVFVSNELMELL